MAASKEVSTPVAACVLGAVILFAVTLITVTQPEAPAAPASAATEPPVSLDFADEWHGLENAIGSCKSRKVTAMEGGSGEHLYWCVNGAEETAKLFINEDGDRLGKVRNIKMMWNEWKPHMPEAGSDQRDASRMARIVMKRYAPLLEEEVLEAFWKREAKVFTANGFRFEYRWTPGPGIDEHLLTVIPGRQ